MRFKTCLFLLVVLLAGVALAQDDVAMQAMKDELQRSVKQLQLQKMDKPYFIAYRMDEMKAVNVSASLGSITESQPSHERTIGVEIRVGDYALDNSNYFSLRGLAGGMGLLSGISQAPIDDNYQQIRRQFWMATDAQYKKALEDFAAKRAALQSRKGTDSVPDFTREAPATVTEAPARETVNVSDLEPLARELSLVFKPAPEILGSSVEIESHDLYTRYVNSEGSSFTRSQLILKLKVAAHTQAADGLPISDSFEIYGRSLADLPAKDVLLNRVRELAGRILQVRTASLVEHYNGPVLFEGEAAGEFFSQQFATGLLAVRTPTGDDARFEAFFNQMMSQMGGSSFANKIGGRVLPDFLNVTDNPEEQSYQGTKLLGAYQVDDDGVKTHATTLVQHGILKTLLATRTPIQAVPHSTGSRRGWGAAPSNLLVTSEKSLGQEELRKELLRLVKDRGLDYGIVVRRLGEGGSAGSFMRMAARMASQPGTGSADAMAEVYKVYPDGHEELVRGLEIAEITPEAFKSIVAVGNTASVFTEEFMPRLGSIFSMGASAAVNAPVVSCVAPSMLFEELSLVKSQGPFPPLAISASPLAKP
jgi:predicted Zn-dependent protease